VIADLRGLRSRGVISALDDHFARTLGRLGEEARPEVLLAAGLVSRNVGEGHVCLDIRGLADGDAFLSEAPEVQWEWPEAEAWLSLLEASALVHPASGGAASAAASHAPLVLDGQGRLYLRRYWDDQQTLAQDLRERIRAETGPESIHEAVLADGLERFFGPAAGPGEEANPQREAAESALRSRFLVISGGPGTGKTFTVVGVLALLIEQALAVGQAPPRIRMVAPTGKAAAHLQASVQRQLASLDCSSEVRDAMPLSASTIHRCLGLGPRLGRRPRYGAENPLEVDVLLVDEASMVDLALMTLLTEALPGAARLVLLGDRDQLASVEAGAVLGDIGRQPEAASSATRAVVHLTRNYRFEAESGIAELTRSINEGDSQAALALLDDAERPEIRLVEPAAGGGWGNALAEAIAAGYAPFQAETGPEGQLAALDNFRILCAHRRGEGGVEALNALAERLLGLGGNPDRPETLPPGRPVGIARNDYELELYNGDVGIVADDPDNPGRAVRVFFRAQGGGPRWLSPLSLGAAETVFATTVHKSQGSEFKAVALVLPREKSPILSRELVYTAVSRARESAVIFASRDVLAEAIERRIQRSSGLSDALWAE